MLATTAIRPIIALFLRHAFPSIGSKSLNYTDVRSADTLYKIGANAVIGTVLCFFSGVGNT